MRYYQFFNEIFQIAQSLYMLSSVQAMMEHITFEAVKKLHSNSVVT